MRKTLQSDMPKRMANLLIVILTFGFSPASFGINITNQVLKYSVMYTRHDVGELEVVLHRDGDTIKTSSISHLSNFAKIFLSEQIIETWFTLVDGKAIVEKGYALNHADQNISDSFTIDRDTGKIIFKNQAEIPIESGDVFESTSFPVGLMTADISSLEGKTVREINPKRARYYTYQKPVKEPLDINGKTYETWKITRNRRGDPNRTVTFWLHLKNHIPLQIITSKQGKDTVMTLVNP